MGQKRDKLKRVEPQIWSVYWSKFDLGGWAVWCPNNKITPSRSCLTYVYTTCQLKEEALVIKLILIFLLFYNADSTQNIVLHSWILSFIFAIPLCLSTICWFFFQKNHIVALRGAYGWKRTKNSPSRGHIYSKHINILYVQMILSLRRQLTTMIC